MINKLCCKEINLYSFSVVEDNKKQQGRPQSPLAMTTEKKYEHDNQALSLQVEALQAQIQDQAKLAKEQVFLIEFC